MLTDRKYMQLSDSAKARYWDIYLMAKDTFDSGLLPSAEDIAFHLRLSNIDQLRKDLRTLVENSFLEKVDGAGEMWRLTRWDIEQAPIPGKDRQAQWRKKSDKRVTKNNEGVTKSHTEVEVEVETEVEGEGEVEVEAAATTSPLCLEMLHQYSIGDPVATEIANRPECNPAWLKSMFDDRGDNETLEYFITRLRRAPGPKKKKIKKDTLAIVEEFRNPRAQKISNFINT